MTLHLTEVGTHHNAVKRSLVRYQIPWLSAGEGHFRQGNRLFPGPGRSRPGQRTGCLVVQQLNWTASFARTSTASRATSAFLHRRLATPTSPEPTGHATLSTAVSMPRPSRSTLDSDKPDPVLPTRFQLIAADRRAVGWLKWRCRSKAISFLPVTLIPLHRLPH